MLYTKHNITELDLEKYTRFVSIGCSFTRWRWPTWADCLAQEMPDAKFINIARGGAGNSYINTMLNFVSRRHNFGPETLVGIMWSTICREDRFILENPLGQKINGGTPGWYTPGNIFGPNQPDNFVKIDELEPFHYLIRDLALISSANCYLKSANFDTLNICSVDMHNQISDTHGAWDRLYQAETPDWVHDHDLMAEPLRIYQDLDDDFVGYMIHDDEEWPEGHVYPWGDNPELNDYHPRSTDYVKYLEKWGIPVSDSTKSFAQAATDAMCDIKKPNWQKNSQWCDTPPGNEGNFLKNMF